MWPAIADHIILLVSGHVTCSIWSLVEVVSLISTPLCLLMLLKALAEDWQVS